MQWHKKIVLLVAMVGIAGCGALNNLAPESKKMDYRSAEKLPPLDLPPELSVPGANNHYTIPDADTGSTTFSSYSKDKGRSSKQSGAGSSVLPVASVEGMRIERAGDQRWLAVRAEPEILWPVVKDFWRELGFTISMEAPETGVMETSWAENRGDIPQDPDRSVLSKILGGVSSVPERDKFRTRFERGSEEGMTEIYISHRGMKEVRESAGINIVWEPRPADLYLEAEMLSRLMVRFGAEEGRVRAAVPDRVQERARIDRNGQENDFLQVYEPFDRAWRRVGLVLDRIGFTVEDRDRSKGIYFVRYVDPNRDVSVIKKKEDNNEHWISKLAFWQDSPGDIAASKPDQYRVQVNGAGAGSEVHILDKDGVTEKSETTNRILNLLYEQLK